MKKIELLSSIAALLVGTAGSSIADALVYEGFNYTASSNITTLPGTGIGFTGGWVTGGAAGNIITGTTVGTSLSFGSLLTSGGSLNLTSNGGNNWQFLNRALGITIANGDTLYESFLFQYNGAGASGDGENFGISAGNNTGIDHTMGLLTRAYNQPGGRLSYNDGTNAVLDTVPVDTNGDVFMFIGRFTNIGGVSSGAAWVLSVDNFNAISGGVIDEAALNANNIGSATLNGTAGAFGTSQFIKIGDFIGNAINYNVDEVRFSNSLADVTPIPEPATIALMAFGGLGWVVMRRRRA